MDRIAALLRRPTADPRPDGELLAAFLGDPDDAAFGELVRRHGPTVWGVCRRALPNLADAEDVFQATFLVLARRASRLVAAPAVGPWLFEVAARTAANVRRKNSRRRTLFAELSDAAADPRPAPTPTDLDTILLGLPGRYRAVLLMCYLEGLTHREAADRLGCAEGTVSSLVSRGLAKLRAKLAGREPAAVLAAAGAAAPAGLTAAVVRSAVAFQSAAVPPTVAELTRGVLHVLWIKKAGTAAVVAAALLAAAVGLDPSAGPSPRAVGQEKSPPKTENLTAQTPPLPGGGGQGQPNKGLGEMSPDGYWLLVARETDGEKKEFPQGVGIEVTINGDEFMTMHSPESMFGGKSSVMCMSTTSWRPAAPLDGKTRGIDLVSQGDKSKAWKEGIYKLDGGKLTICWGEEKRPTDFTAKPGSGNTVNVFKRLDGGDRKNAAPAKPAQPGTGGETDGKKAEPPA